jgi:hypothetical protein
MKIGLPAVFSLSAFFYSISGSAQTQLGDSTSSQAAFNRTTAVYYNQLGDQSPLLNGSLYLGYDVNFAKGTPYFLSPKPGNGSVVYDSLSYPDLSLVYDDYRQFLVVVDQSFQLKLLNERISSFSIQDHQFERLLTGKTNKGLPESGFYEVLYPGKSKVLKYTVKKTREVLSISDGITHYIDETDYYFIKKGDIFASVNTKSELFKQLKDHKKDVQRFIGKNKLNFRSDKANTLAQVAAYYDKLAN